MTVSLSRAAAVILALVGVVALGQVGDPGTEDVDAVAALESLTVAPAADVNYDPKTYGGWLDLDRDCKDTRAEILEVQLEDEVLDGCRVASGTFRDRYTGVSGEVIAERVQIDHIVSKADADRSGAHDWSRARKVAFTNDPTNLVATNSTANRCKSDKGPAEWDLPPKLDETVCGRQRAPENPADRCWYAKRYARTKARWNLTVTVADKVTLAPMLAGCR